MLTALPAASAWGSAQLRLVNARQQAVGLSANGTPAADSTPFGQATPYASVPPGRTTLMLTGAGADGSSTEELTDGARYTAVATARGVTVFKDGTAKGRRTRLRVIHAAPELGGPDVLLGKRAIAEELRFNRASPYLTIAPGSYDVMVARPGSTRAIFEKRISVAAGSATTVVIAGSGGAPGQLIEVTDDTVTPAGPPETGLGGLASGDAAARWAAIAALVAGLLGGVAQLTLARRSGRR